MASTHPTGKNSSEGDDGEGGWADFSGPTSAMPTSSRTSEPNLFAAPVVASQTATFQDTGDDDGDFGDFSSAGQAAAATQPTSAKPGVMTLLDAPAPKKDAIADAFGDLFDTPLTLQPAIKP